MLAALMVLLDGVKFLARAYDGAPRGFLALSIFVAGHFSRAFIYLLAVLLSVVHQEQATGYLGLQFCWSACFEKPGKFWLNKFFWCSKHQDHVIATPLVVLGCSDAYSECI